jgi:hypothetical protein
MTPAIRIRARSPRGHCRCGVRHPPTPTLHPPGAFSPEQVNVLLDDPALVVEVVGELAMGALTGSEIATVMAGAFREGTVLTGWEAHAPNPPPAAAPEDGADGGVDQPDEAAPPSVDEPAPAPAVEDAPARAPARKAKGT